VYGDGEQTRDYVYVGDVVEANLAATRWSPPAVTSLDDLAFNVGTGVETSVNALAQAMIEAAGVTVGVSHAEARPGELQRSAVAVEKAKREWGWKPRFALDQGLKRTYEWIAEEVA
jgi:UDP-glucose 4-epimerase